MNYLVLGTVLAPEAFSYNLAANPASTKWLSGFLDGLIACQTEITVCGHCYTQAWPKGPLLAGRREYLDHRYDNHLVRFWNIPGIRFDSMARSYYQTASKLINDSDYDAVVTYNPYPWHTSAARRLRRLQGLPWICLNLDFDDVGQGWEQFLCNAGDADGHLFLSHWGYQNAPVRNKIHLDSGVSELAENFGARAVKDQLNIVYLGKLSQSGGLDVLLALPKLVPDLNVRFIYGGKGYPGAVAKLNALAATDSRVDFRGFVKDNEVQDLFSCADIFINPRDPHDVVNDMVFPSKIMHYLQTGKTVVSTWTKGLEPIYRDMMLISETASLEDFGVAIRQAVNESPDQRSARERRIKEVLLGSRLWSSQVQRFNAFVSSTCESMRGQISE